MVLSILLVATFACCPSETLPPGVTVEGIVEDAIAADAELDTCRFDTDMTMDFSMTMMGETVEGTMTSYGEGAIDEPNEKMYMDMVMTVTVTGEEDIEMSMEMYIVEDWVYMKMEVPEGPTGWMKAPMEMGDWEEMDIASQQVDWLPDAEVEFLRTETVDGTECYVLAVTPDLEKLAEWAEQQGVEEVAQGVDLSEVITDFSIEQWVAKETHFTLKTTIDMTMTFSNETLGLPPELVGEVEMTYDIVATTLIYDINQPVTIELPPEAEDAEEVPEL